jgi:predicted lipoprotein with Yx(FWY)xxD motif
MAEEEAKTKKQVEKKASYGKRPLWQWFLIYVVVGGILYALVYFFYIGKRGGYNYNTSNSQQYAQPTDSMTDTNESESMGVSNDVLSTMMHIEKGDYLTDTQGMTVYTFDNDEPGKSNCDSSCLSNWPPYSAPSSESADLPANIGVTQATDGTYMYTWKGMPLYYYVADQAPGDINGDGVGGIWHIITP